MARIASINLLPEITLEALNERIRRSGYGDSDGHTEWLREKGERISRSAIARHAQVLRRVDASHGMPCAQIAEARAPKTCDRAILLQQLGKLELEKARITARLLALDN